MRIESHEYANEADATKSRHSGAKTLLNADQE